MTTRFKNVVHLEPGSYAAGEALAIMVGTAQVLVLFDEVPADAPAVVPTEPVRKKPVVQQAQRDAESSTLPALYKKIWYYIAKFQGKQPNNVFIERMGLTHSVYYGLKRVDRCIQYTPSIRKLFRRSGVPENLITAFQALVTTARKGRAQRAAITRGTVEPKIVVVEIPVQLEKPTVASLALAERVRARQDLKAWTNKRMAEIANVPASFMSNLRHGLLNETHTRVLAACVALGVDSTKLVPVEYSAGKNGSNGSNGHSSVDSL